MADMGVLGRLEALGKVFASQHGDVVGESVPLVVREVMEAEVATLAGRGALQALWRPRRLPQLLPAARVGH